MSVTLSADQFAALLSAKTMPKKRVKSLLTDFNDAPNIEDLINGDNFILPDVMSLGCVELPRYYGDCIIKNIEQFQTKEIPIHCTDYRRKKFYYRTNNAWMKGDDFVQKFMTKIYRTTMATLCERLKNHSTYCETQAMIASFNDNERFPHTKLKEKILTYIAKPLSSSEYSITSDEE